MFRKNPKSKAFLSLRLKDQIGSDVLLAAVEMKMQSDDTFFDNGTMLIRYDYINQPRGRGRPRLRLGAMDKEKFLKRKASIVGVRRNDNMCLPRSLAVAVAHAQFKADPDDLKRAQYQKIRKGRAPQQKMAEDLCRLAGVQISPDGCGYEELLKFQSYFYSQYRIHVYYAEPRGKDMYFKGQSSAPASSTINLVFDGSHFSACLSVKALFRCGYFCDHCVSPFQSMATYMNHYCSSICSACKSSPSCDVSTSVITCDHCLRKFYGEECYNQHVLVQEGQTVSLCEKLRRCKDCLSLMPWYRKEDHVCGEIYCRICKSKQDVNHRCYIQPYKSKKSKDKFIMFFYDFECMFQKIHNGTENSYEHIPNLCVLDQVCHECIDDDDLSNPCDLCGDRHHVFTENPAKELLQHITQSKFQDNFSSLRGIAHNARGYDCHLVLKSLVNDFTITPNVIMNGLKILNMAIPYSSLSFIDSLCFLPLSLSELPKAFGLEHLLAKGYFPIFFNTPENQNYVGPPPDMKFYGYESMSEEKRKHFMTWYSEIAVKQTFDLQKELLMYCENDVEILRKACLVFRKDFIEENDIDPFLEALSIAGAAMAVFRKKYLKPETIGVIPKGGYRLADAHSKKSLEWLLYEEHQRGITIQHAGRGREFQPIGCAKVCKKKFLLIFFITLCFFQVDGYHEGEAENTVYQFHGCLFHSHECLAGRYLQHPLDPSETFETKREKTELMTQRLRDRGYTVSK